MYRSCTVCVEYEYSIVCVSCLTAVYQNCIVWSVQYKTHLKERVKVFILIIHWTNLQWSILKVPLLFCSRSHSVHLPCPCAIQHPNHGQQISLDISCSGATWSTSTWFSQCAAVCVVLLSRTIGKSCGSLCCSVCSVLHVSLSSFCASEGDWQSLLTPRSHTDTHNTTATRTR